MSNHITYEEFLKSLAYPVFIEKIKFSEKQLKRSKPHWFWSSARKKAFFKGKARLFSLWRFSASPEYKKLSLYQSWFKVRDFLNTGKVEDYPVVEEGIRRNIASAVMRNILLGEKSTCQPG